MKRLFLTLVAALLGLAAAAQSDLPAVKDTTATKDSVTVKDTVVDKSAIAVEDSTVNTAPRGREIDGGHSKKSSDANIIGSPRYFDGEGDESEEYRRPRGGAMRYFGHDFCSVFGETMFMTGFHDSGLGLQLAYVPEKWGGYGTYIYGRHHDWFSLGAVWRLSEPWSNTDFQLYAGANYGHGYGYGYHRSLGYELGMRLAVTQSVNWGSFCWTSLSLGVMRNAGHSYLTVGLSLDLTLIPLLLIF